MFISKLYIKDFRNIDNIELNFNKKANFFKGFNGAGKTNIIESIYCLSAIKSFRNAKDKDMVKKEKEYYYIKCSVEDISESLFEIGFSLSEEKKKKLKINGNEIHQPYDYYGKFPSVIFSPADIELIQGYNDIFRKYIDGVICKYDRDYFINLQNYRKCIFSRNTLIKNSNINSINKSDIIVWNELIASLAEKIMLKRKNFISEYSLLVKDAYIKIAGNDNKLTVRYSQSFKAEKKEDILIELEKISEKDLSLGYTSSGPHRDRYLFFNEEGYDFTKVSSQGQKRTAVISFKIAESILLKKNTDKEAVLLVDDIFSELDIKRQKNLLFMLKKENQIFFTMTDISDDLLSTFDSYNVYNIDKGSAVLINELQI
jgi:DNA replication and repair protein RecF